MGTVKAARAAMNTAGSAQTPHIALAGELGELPGPLIDIRFAHRSLPPVRAYANLAACVRFGWKRDIPDFPGM